MRRKQNTLFVSTRERFGPDDPAWNTYLSWIELPQLREVRTLDVALNNYVEDCGDLYPQIAEVQSALELLPRPRSRREYYLVACPLESEMAAFDGFEFLGCDLSDETMTSSLLNCGPWRGALEQFGRRLNAYGLLAVEDAREAQKLLPIEWGAAEPHAFVNIWALFGRAS